MKKNIGNLIVLILILSFFTIDFGNSRAKGCAFCRQEVLDAQTFYEGKGVLGLLTHKPALNGHVLIIPKRHVERFEDLTPQELIEMSKAIKKIDCAVRDVFGYKDYLLIQKNGHEAGQSVPHVHFHYLPAANFLAARFLLSPLFKPLSQEKLKILKDVLSESLLKSDATFSSQI